MKNQHTNLTPKAGFVRLAALLAIALGLVVSTSADVNAQGSITSFNLAISSSELVLESPNDSMVMHFQSWDSPLNRILERNMPFLEVQNNNNSTANITEIRLTIGDTDFNFTDAVLGEFAVLGTTTPNVVIDNSTGGDVLVVQFGDGGLAPGEVARFQFDIDADPDVEAFVHPDYRTVLFDVNGNDDTDNSIASVVFADAGEEGEDVVQERRFPDFQQNGPIFANAIIRPYSIMENVEYFGLPVPEPTSFAMLALIGLGMTATKRKIRKSAVDKLHGGSVPPRLAVTSV
ncbi:PEP-CTERM sorting domain-containing protein [Pirellulales bacterium]|nr:PEP-CTERM sorting domain-containing protein [Pirellulales bacterium]